MKRIPGPAGDLGPQAKKAAISSQFRTTLPLSELGIDPSLITRDVKSIRTNYSRHKIPILVVVVKEISWSPQGNAAGVIGDDTG